METENQKLDTTFLKHYGTLGMKWGERRYQNKDGSLTPEGRRHWGIGPPREKRKSFRLETKEERAERLALKKAKKLKKIELKKKAQEEEIEATKKRLIETGDRDGIYNNRRLFTNEELDEAIKRIDKIEKINPPVQGVQVVQGNQNKQGTQPVQEAPAEKKSLMDRLFGIKESATEKKKAAILAKADPKEIYDNRHLFTDEELKSAFSRIDTLSKIDPDKKAAAQKSEKDGKTKTEQIIDNLGTATKIVAGVGGLALAGWKAYEQIGAVTNEAVGTFTTPEERAAKAKKLHIKNTRAGVDANPVDLLMEKLLSDGMPLGVIDPDNKLKVQKAKNLSLKDFKKLCEGYDLDDNQIEELYKRTNS